jgi:hypothetical protein
MAKWWAIVVAGAAATLLFAWLGRLAGVPLATLVTIGAGLAALMWMIVLVTIPWNLYFDARRIPVDNEISRGRGITVAPRQDEEARRIARLMLWFALGGHLGTAAVAAVFAYVSGAVTGYYLAGFYLVSTTIRPASAYVIHLRERIAVLRRESTHPRRDVVSLTATVDTLGHQVREALQELQSLRSEQTTLDRELRDRIEQMARRVEGALDGMSDHQELLTGVRALVRMIRTT